MSKFVRESVDQGTARVTLDRPELHNAFDEIVIGELTASFERMAERDDVRVIVLAATGKSFCSGADVHWMKRMVDYSFEENVEDAAAMARMLRTIRECPKPVIGRVHGAAIGGGVGLVAACDMSVAVASAVFSLSEVKLGILPAVISPYVIEKIGAGTARRYALTAERFAAAEAKRIGLVSEVADSPADLDALIQKWARLMIENGPEALRACKAVLSAVGAQDWETVSDLTVNRIARQRVSTEGQEGLLAFIEKRKPDWAR